MKLTPSKIRYLLTIYEINPDTYSVRSIDIASRLKISRSSVNNMVDYLIDQGFVEKELYGNVLLTEKGQIIASELYAQYKVVLRFYLQQLKIDGSEAREEAINTVSFLGENCIEKLVRFLNLNSHTTLPF